MLTLLCSSLSTMRSLLISGLYTLHVEPIVWPVILPWPLKRYSPFFIGHPLNSSIRWSVRSPTLRLSPQVRVCPLIYPRPDISQHTHAIKTRAVWKSIFALRKTWNVRLLLLFVMDSSNGVHRGQLAIAVASFPLQKIPFVVLESDGTAAFAASVILNSSNGGGTYTPMICLG